MIPLELIELNQNKTHMDFDLRMNEPVIAYEYQNTKRSINGQIGINDLPHEMLTKIIRNLPLRSRKIVKLVCKTWADVCDDVVFLQKEKLVLCGIYGLGEILEVLMSSQRMLLNIDFHNVNFANQLTPFWSKHGQKIRELAFHDCMLHDETVDNIFSYCVNLSCLSLICRTEQYQHCDKTIISKTSIDRLIERKMKNTKLHSLSIEIPASSYLNNYIFYGIFNTFPAIKKIQFSCGQLEDSFQSINVDDIELLSLHKLTFAIFLFKIRSSADKIEKIDFQFNRFTSFTTEAIASVHNLARLKSLTLRSDDVSPWPTQTIINFICRQWLLEVVAFVAPFSQTNESNAKFLIKLLDKCSNLRHLEVRMDEMNINCELFEKLARSKLRTLKMECTRIYIDAESIRVKPNETLENLYLYELRRNGEVSSKFIETFRNLRYLYVRYVSDTVLDAIWKYQTDLRFLIFAQSESHRHNDNLFCIRRPGIRLSTSNLEYFEVETWYPKKGLVPDLIANYFPNLRYLNLGKFELYTKIDLESLQHLSQLEFLSLNFNIKEDLWYYSLIDLCSKLKNLRYLRIKSHQYSSTNFQNVKLLISDKGIVQELFACCPSIRMFIFSFWSLCGIEAYYCDVTEMRMKKIFKENEWILEFFPNRWSLIK